MNAPMTPEQEERAEGLDRLFALQQTRMGTAIAMWQEATDKRDVLPDLGDLLGWLLAEVLRERERARAENEELRANWDMEIDSVAEHIRLLGDRTQELKVAETRIEALEGALKSIANNTCCTTCQEAALVARRALLPPAPSVEPLRVEASEAVPPREIWAVGIKDDVSEPKIEDKIINLGCFESDLTAEGPGEGEK